MNSRRNLLIAGLLLLAGIGGAVVYYKQKNLLQEGIRPTPESELRLTNAEGEPIEPLEFSPDTEIRFNKTLLIYARSIAIDGGSAQKVPCEGRNGKPELIGFIKEKEMRLELICVNDFLGGISLQYQEGSGKKIHLNLGRSEGDAGDLWDTRSLISKTGEGVLHIDSITLTSSQDFSQAEKPDDIPPPVCEEQQVAFTWDPTKSTFVETVSSKYFKPTDFAPPIEIDDGCLTSEGRWSAE